MELLYCPYPYFSFLWRRLLDILTIPLWDQKSKKTSNVAKRRTGGFLSWNHSKNSTMVSTSTAKTQESEPESDEHEAGKRTSTHLKPERLSSTPHLRSRVTMHARKTRSKIFPGIRFVPIHLTEQEQSRLWLSAAESTTVDCLWSRRIRSNRSRAWWDPLPCLAGWVPGSWPQRKGCQPLFLSRAELPKRGQEQEGEVCFARERGGVSIGGSGRLEMKKSWRASERAAMAKVN